MPAFGLTAPSMLDSDEAVLYRFPQLNADLLARASRPKGWLI